MLIGVPLVVLIVAIAPTYLKFSPIEITKTEPEIQRKVFEKNDIPAEVGNSPSKTVYKFECDSKIDFETEEQSKISDDKWQVRIKVKRVKTELKLPITVWLNQEVDNRRTDFESGHVKICQRVYLESQVPATAACKSALSRSFFGQGKDLESAQKAAIEAAKQEIKEQYVEVVDNKAKDVFVIYDFYSPTWTRSSEVLVDKALQDYEMGKPRKLKRI